MNLNRIIKHLFYPGWWLRRDFPPHELARIEAAIRQSEENHSGEIRFAIESSLPLKALWRNELMHERALEVFSLLRVWDTEDNNGVLIYLLLADRQVEIRADRNIHHKVDAKEWQKICQIIQEDFRHENYGDGVVKGIEKIGELLAEHFPVSKDDENELSNKPVIL